MNQPNNRLPITHFLASYAISEGLKKIGFNEPCIALFSEKYSMKDYWMEWHRAVGQYQGGNIYGRCYIDFVVDEKYTFVFSPLYEQAVEWLSRNKKIELFVFPKLYRNKIKYCFEVIDLRQSNEGLENMTNGIFIAYNSRKEAYEAALLFILVELL